MPQKLTVLSFSLPSAIMSLRRLAVILTTSSAAAYSYLSTADIYAGPIGRCFNALDPERAHDIAVRLAKYRITPPFNPFRKRQGDPPRLATTVWGLYFSNPIGLAAGFDKHAEAMRGLFGLGFGFLEVGSVTPLPQPGNPKPRVFRLAEDAAIVNRYGFNSVGMHTVRDRLFQYDSGGTSQHRMGVLGINLGKNKDTPQHLAVDDYVAGVSTLGEFAEYIVINVSSPNTMGLRHLQAKQHLRDLLQAVLRARDALVYRPPILVKIAPDLTPEQLQDVCDVALQLCVDGLIVSNTTIDRSGLVSANGQEKGGLSGRPLREKSTAVLRDVYRFTNGKIPLVGVGGVESGQHAYEKIRAGASLVQIYTALVYRGPNLVATIKDELDALLARDGFKTVADAVGADHKLDRNAATKG